MSAPSATGVFVNSTVIAIRPLAERSDVRGLGFGAAPKRLGRAMPLDRPGEGRRETSVLFGRRCEGQCAFPLWGKGSAKRFVCGAPTEGERIYCPACWARTHTGQLALGKPGDA